jgi:glucose-1-phosphate cytidylyltransferase
MKVVLFCGGLGMRMREFSEDIPKPMVKIGYRPILWHVMKYYAYYGHKDFVLCLGYKADTVKDYFVNYDECVSNNFVLSGGDVKLLTSDIQDWNIAFIDTGVTSNIGQRLKAVEDYLKNEEVFLANYADGLSDLPLTSYINYFLQRQKVACFLSVKPTQSFHIVRSQDDIVQGIQPVKDCGMWMNAGFFVFKKEIFRYIRDGEELVNEPFQRLIQKGEIISPQYSGFWKCMDTFKEKQQLEDIYSGGEAPWEVWKSSSKKPELTITEQLTTA